MLVGAPARPLHFSLPSSSFSSRGRREGFVQQWQFAHSLINHQLCSLFGSLPVEFSRDGGYHSCLYLPSSSSRTGELLCRLRSSSTTPQYPQCALAQRVPQVLVSCCLCLTHWANACFSSNAVFPLWLPGVLYLFFLSPSLYFKFSFSIFPVLFPFQFSIVTVMISCCFVLSSDPFTTLLRWGPSFFSPTWCEWVSREQMTELICRCLPPFAFDILSLAMSLCLGGYLSVLCNPFLGYHWAILSISLYTKRYLLRKKTFKCVSFKNNWIQ